MTLSDHRDLTARLFILGVFFCMGVVVILLRLTYLQVWLSNDLHAVSEKNFTRIETIMVPRGEIVDRRGELLATNRPVANVYWHGSGNYRLDQEQRNSLQQLSDIIGTEKTDNAITQRITLAERHKRHIPIAKDVGFERLSQIAEQCAHSKNIVIANQFERYYPHGTLACHLVGYLGADELNKKIGKTGLEKQFHEQLQGQEGIRKKIINSFGSPIKQTEINPRHVGDTIVTTIDLHLQKIIEEIFPENLSGTFIVMDPQDGSLRAVLSRPSFDPSIFLKPISHETWHELQEKKTFINRAFAACYPPASLFKLVSVSTGIEQGIISPDHQCNCKGFYRFGGRNFRCNRLWGHGEIDTKHALAQSCNIVFYEIGKRVSIDTLADYAHRFGLGEPTGLIMQENSGFIPTATWKLERKGERWWQGETLCAAIGQTYMLATPLQMVRMTASILTGNLVKPRLLETEAIETQPLAIRDSTREFLNKAMKKTVKYGTGRSLKKITDMQIYAKTGTAQTSSLSLRKLGGKHLEHAWFVANFIYKEHRPLTLMVLIEHAGNSRPAQLMAKQFFGQYKRLLDKKTQTNH